MSESNKQAFKQIEKLWNSHTLVSHFSYEFSKVTHKLKLVMYQDVVNGMQPIGAKNTDVASWADHVALVQAMYPHMSELSAFTVTNKEGYTELVIELVTAS